MKKLKVMTFVGTRPEIIKLSRVIAKLDKFTNHILVHTCQNYDYELNEIFFEDLDIRKPNYFLNAAGLTSTETIGKILIEADAILEKLKPEAVMVLGDTNSCMSLIAAKKRKIPTFHLEAGNRCFDLRVPEEVNRKILDHAADINITFSSLAREYLFNEGLPKDMIIKVGSPMLEVINFYKDKVTNSRILSDLEISENNYFLVSIHREENINSKNFYKISEILNSIADKYKIPIIVSSHPRTRKKIEQSKCSFNNKIRFLTPQNLSNYLKLQIKAKTVLSDSGTINEESSILNFPALNIREAHERPEAMEETSVIMTGINCERILQSLDLLSIQAKEKSTDLKLVDDYNIKNFSEKILRIIISYTDYVKRNIWKEY